MNRRQCMFKIESFLPQIKQNEVKKNGQVVRRMTVRSLIISPGIEGLDFY